MDYATYIRVKAEMADHRRFMQEHAYPNEANEWRVQPSLLQRLSAPVKQFLLSTKRSAQDSAPATTTEPVVNQAHQRTQHGV